VGFTEGIGVFAWTYMQTTLAFELVRGRILEVLADVPGLAVAVYAKQDQGVDGKGAPVVGLPLVQAPLWVNKAGVQNSM